MKTLQIAIGFAVLSFAFPACVKHATPPESAQGDAFKSAPVPFGQSMEEIESLFKRQGIEMNPLIPQELKSLPDRVRFQILQYAGPHLFAEDGGVALARPKALIKMFSKGFESGKPVILIEEFYDGRLTGMAIDYCPQLRSSEQVLTTLDRVRKSLEQRSGRFVDDLQRKGNEFVARHTGKDLNIIVQANPKQNTLRVIYFDYSSVQKKN